MSARAVTAKRRPAPAGTIPLLVLGLALCLAGCSKTLTLVPTPNQIPTVRLVTGPIDTTAVCHPRPGVNCYTMLLRWSGFDPDGRVEYFAYAIDPPDIGDTTWVKTTEKEKTFVFETEDGGTGGADSLTVSHGFHVIVFRAIDDRGAWSEPAIRAFFAWTNAPRVQILNPHPRRTPNYLPTTVRMSWQGVDDDALDPQKRPARYKYKLLGPVFDDVPGGLSALITNPGSLIRHTWAPDFRAEDGWATVGRETTSVQFTDLQSGGNYVFIVVAIDESGAYSPIFDVTRNVMYFTSTFAVAQGPIMSIFNSTFFYKYPGASYSPTNEVRIEVPAGLPVTFMWSATPPPGADIYAYRWMLDGDVFDDDTRTSDITDLNHWSAPSGGTTAATVGPFGPGDHYFYAQAEDNTGLKSLATVHFVSVAGTFERPLLIVDDTRRQPDAYYANGTPVTSTAPWPSAAELDTFLYAHGGAPWKGATAGAVSPPGLLSGYVFDTLGTRVTAPEGAAALAKLAHYSHVVWLQEFEGARNINPLSSLVDPMTLLNYMTAAGSFNSLRAYIEMGGEVWIVGGGTAMATTFKLNKTANDELGGGIRFGSSGKDPELVQGGFMYDVPHWRSTIRVVPTLSSNPTANLIRSLGRFKSNPGIYAGVPLQLDSRTTTTDPMPPTRTSASLFYSRSYSCEYLETALSVLEPVGGDPVADFAIDAFDDADPRRVLGRWQSSDTLNTVVGTVVVADDDAVASGHALRLRTRGGGASSGDEVRHMFEYPVDYSGMLSIRLALREDAGGSAVTWRVRLFDGQGRSISAVVPSTGTPNVFMVRDVLRSAFVPDPVTGAGFDVLHVMGIALALDYGDAPATTDVDDLRAVTSPVASALDTLMAINSSYFANKGLGPTMTVYHGHDTPRPFIITGFTPWMFRRTQCRDLFDFVLNGMWGLQRSAVTTSATARSLPLAPAAPRR